MEVVSRSDLLVTFLRDNNAFAGAATELSAKAARRPDTFVHNRPIPHGST
jgi:hypothetical protein